MIRILVPLDGSKIAESAIRHAVAMSQVFSAEIELLSVIGDAKADSVNRGNSVDWQLWRRQTQVYLSRMAETLCKNDLQVSWQLREGNAAQEIIQHINEADIDLLVLSRYGMGDANQFAGGGTAQKVISASAASVLLTDPAYEFDEERGYARILVAVDNSQRSEWASRFAAMVAQASGGSLHLLHIVEEPQFAGGAPIGSETRLLIDDMMRLTRSQANFQLNHLTSGLTADIDVESTVAVSDDIAMCIESTAEQDHADLLVVAAQASRDRAAGGRYGPTCETLLAHVHRPVLVLRSEATEPSVSRFRSVFLDETCADAV